MSNVESFVYSLKQFFNNASSNSIVDYSTSQTDLSTTTSNSPESSILLSDVNTSNCSSAKRRRPRRNPVWQYFRVENGLAVCKHCNYNTKSVFSTNLKVHLRSHHRKLFDLVSS